MKEYQIQFAYKSDPTQPELWQTVAVTQIDQLAGVAKHAMDVIKGVMDGTLKTFDPAQPGKPTMATRLLTRDIGPMIPDTIAVDDPPREHLVEWDESSNDPAQGGKRVVGILYSGFTLLEAKMAADVAVNFESYYIKFIPKQPMPPSPHHGWDATPVIAENFGQPQIGVSNVLAIIR